jgi:hypothetical protein
MQTGPISAVTFAPAQRTTAGVSIGLLQSPQERRMIKSAIRFLTLSACAVALGMVPMLASVTAAPNNSAEIEKHKKRVQNSAGISDPRSSSPAWPPPTYDDPDRKTAVGGGGM